VEDLDELEEVEDSEEPDSSSLPLPQLASSPPAVEHARREAPSLPYSDPINKLHSLQVEDEVTSSNDSDKLPALDFLDSSEQQELPLFLQKPQPDAKRRLQDSHSGKQVRKRSRLPSTIPQNEHSECPTLDDEWSTTSLMSIAPPHDQVDPHSKTDLSNQEPITISSSVSIVSDLGCPETNSVLADLAPLKWLHTKTLDKLLYSLIPNCDKFHMYDPGNVATGTPPSPVTPGKFARCDHIFVTLCLKKHWCLLRYHPRHATIHIYDSMSAYSDQNLLEHHAMIIGNVVWDASSPPTPPIWKLVRAQVAQQNNAHDCGVLTVVNGLYAAMEIEVTPPNDEPSYSTVWRLLLQSVLADIVATRDQPFRDYLTAMFASSDQSLDTIGETDMRLRRIDQDLASALSLADRLHKHAHEAGARIATRIQQTTETYAEQVESLSRMHKIANNQKPVGTRFTNAGEFQAFQDEQMARVKAAYQVSKTKDGRVLAAVEKSQLHIMCLLFVIKAFRAHVGEALSSLVKSREALIRAAEDHLQHLDQEVTESERQMKLLRQKQEKHRVEKAKVEASLVKARQPLV
jgi:hypothetical protein